MLVWFHRYLICRKIHFFTHTFLWLCLSWKIFPGTDGEQLDFLVLMVNSKSNMDTMTCMWTNGPLISARMHPHLPRLHHTTCSANSDTWWEAQSWWLSHNCPQCLYSVKYCEFLMNTIMMKSTGCFLWTRDTLYHVTNLISQDFFLPLKKYCPSHMMA